MARCPRAREPIVAFDLDRERSVNSEKGRRGWLREGRRQLDELRKQQARPVAGPRTERLKESKRRLEEEHQVELESNAAYETYRATAARQQRPTPGSPTGPLHAVGGADRDAQHD